MVTTAQRILLMNKLLLNNPDATAKDLCTEIKIIEEKQLAEVREKIRRAVAKNGMTVRPIIYRI